jgi:hypothetical protein
LPADYSRPRDIVQLTHTNNPIKAGERDEYFARTLKNDTPDFRKNLMGIQTFAVY